MKLYASKDFDSSEGTVQLHSPTSDGHLLYHPRPNLHDPNDPLRWPTWKKYAAFTSVCTFGFLTNYGIGGLAPAFYLLSKEFHKSQNETSNLLLWPILILGIGNFFWVPVGNYIGKRPVFVLSTFILALTYLWGALAPTFSSLLWSNIIASFAGAASEAVAVSTVNDLFYLVRIRILSSSLDPL
jgi:MFS family permease